MDIDKTRNIIKVSEPLKSDIKIIRLLICCGIFFMLIFISWFANPEHIGYTSIYCFLTFALLFKLVKMIHEWYHYWSPSIPKASQLKKQWSVDVLTTACPGEPREMIIRTLKAMKAIHYPHTNYLCDEGDDPILKKVCKDLGIIHVTRTEKNDAKAGNINNALKQSTGEISVVLDPDHEPIPEFLDRVLPYFENEQIGFVQSVQAYGNQKESFIARGAAEQTYDFYGPMMMCMNSYGTVQAIGANCAFRRKALDSIGGHAAGLAEDMHTAMQLHAKGWKSVYIPEILTRGLVPATLSSYYKQQLKWSRGTFELLFRTFPKLYKNFTWRQRIHYFTIPLYFLFGLINLIDIAIPVFALGMAQVPWEINLNHFAQHFFPLWILSLVIRLYAQRWLLEKHERGFHFTGGILRTATWWIFLIGFIYTIFKIKVPYIPTPKEDEHENYFKLNIPNIIVLCIVTIFVFYGLSLDWTPYSLVMASYSLVTASMLAFTILISQQKFLLSVKRLRKKTAFLNITMDLVGLISQKIQQVFYNLFRNGAVVLIIALSLIFVSYSNTNNELNDNPALIPKELGGFYLGIEFSKDKNDINELNLLEKNIQKPFNLLSFTQSWGDTIEPFPVKLMFDISKRGALPFITWQANQLPDTSENNSAAICKGRYDHYLKKCAAFLRNYKSPVFISFLHSPENSNKQSPQQFIKDWQYIYTYFNKLGISNITWVWCPGNIKEESFYPGEKFVDWIGVSCLNYGENFTSKDRYTFSNIYIPYRNCLGKFKKPIMLTRLGCAAGPIQAEWFANAFADIQSKFQEIKSAILYTGANKIVDKHIHYDSLIYNENFVFRNKLTLKAIATQLQIDPLKRNNFIKPINIIDTAQKKYKSDFVKGTPGNFQLLINKQPYYIRGVAYNTAHDWRDGNMPLTRRQVVKDFQNIKEMGANTIRRYSSGIYDRNVLNIAAECKLNVLYGFWFDPKVDFYSDSLKVQAYINEVEKKVMQYKDHSAIIGWSLGNESWGLFKHRYAKPYLTAVRAAYIQFIEHLAQRLHELDPGRPVFSCIEHEEYQLAGELVAFHDGAPSVDVIGINSYYEEQINKLNHIAWQFDSMRPYLVSEFGPRGYWDPKYNKTLNHSVVEQTDSEKAAWYKEQWVTYVNGYKGYNVGGFAYCWHDRMEGSYTWFGLTDFKGRLKPAYYALKEQWVNVKYEPFTQFSIQCPSTLLPGNEYSFYAITNSNNKADFNYEWRLLKNEYLDQVKNIERSDDPASIRVTIPEEQSDYRLYLFVTDKNKQRVTTASVPIKVQQNKLQ